MSELKQEIKVEGATVAFYTYKENGFEVIEFDSSSCVPPEPMINAMLGLELLKHSQMKLVMINHRSPVGLYPKIAEHFQTKESVLADGRVKVEVFYKDGVSDKADLSDKSCNG